MCYHKLELSPCSFNDIYFEIIYFVFTKPNKENRAWNMVLIILQIGKTSLIWKTCFF